MMIFFTSISFAQENNIYKLPDNSDQNSLRSSRITNYPQDLLYDLEPSVYIKNNNVENVVGVASPKVLKLKDVNSIPFLSNRNALYNKVEMITINVTSLSDLSRPFIVDDIRGFANLKYIYIKSEFLITENQIRNFIQNADPEISIFYKIFNRS
ncbi:hypothetical protein DI383_12030 [Flavobacteriaceae bacterium LYZ1037]|nr:hypothetical protein DI383_12030 [Flavobacteriaceae bacterium LYZ1037]